MKHEHHELLFTRAERNVAAMMWADIATRYPAARRRDPRIAECLDRFVGDDIAAVRKSREGLAACWRRMKKLPKPVMASEVAA